MNYSQNNYELIIAMLCMCVCANHVASVAYITLEKCEVFLTYCRKREKRRASYVYLVLYAGGTFTINPRIVSLIHCNRASTNFFDREYFPSYDKAHTKCTLLFRAQFLLVEI